MKISENVDGISFYRVDEKNIKIEGFEIKELGIKNPGSTMGDLYDIVIFADINTKPFFPERFEAILTSPIDYVNRMVENGFLGTVVKSTDKSKKFVDDVYDQILKDYESYKESQDDE
jgi:hypothetical protein